MRIHGEILKDDQTIGDLNFDDSEVLLLEVKCLDDYCCLGNQVNIETVATSM